MEKYNKNKLNELLDLVKTLMKEENTEQQLSIEESYSMSEEKSQKNLIFTEKEIEKMPKTFRKEFRTDGCTAKIRKKKVSKNAYTYEIRYRRNGSNVCITDKNLENGKKRFIEKLKTAEKVVKAVKGTPRTFNAFSMFYFENFRKKWIYILGTVMILGVGISRLYLGVHYPGDIIFGALVGALSGYVCYKIYQKLHEKIFSGKANPYKKAKNINVIISVLYITYMLVLIFAPLINFKIK